MTTTNPPRTGPDSDTSPSTRTLQGRAGAAAPPTGRWPSNRGTLMARNLTFTHPGNDRPTVEDATLTVDAGQMLALIGPSGSGKTTLLRLIAGLDTPERGQVHVNGVDLTTVPPEQRGMTMMFQRPLLFPHLDVLDNIAFSDRVAGVRRRQARTSASRYLDLVHLPGLARRRPRSLSGGQEQRVALARALASRPGVLLLDEPFSALDASVRHSMHELLAEVRAMLEPTTVIVTHDLDEAGQADTVAVLTGGRVAQVGTLTELYDRPATVEVARVLGGFSEVAGVARDGVHHSRAGRVPLPAFARGLSGPAVLLVRCEGLRMVHHSSPDVVFTGAVASVQQHGLRQSAVVHAHAATSGQELRMVAEADLGCSVRPGDRVGLRLTGVGVCALPLAAGDAPGGPAAA
ncbi:ABC transporter ATP-binding protein [Pedococcus sp. NPDC057267]|uniref:ABC transporter ATP-binding protein n=1 Tax=Pedococcus sp. NPDC057267 TaxID=3346077 RepID=UPI00363F75B2